MPTGHAWSAGVSRPGDAELDELLGAYALDAVDDDERRRVDEYLRRSPGARREVGEHLEVAALLGSAAGEPPPPTLWDRLERRLPDAPAARRGIEQDADARRGRRPRPSPSRRRPVPPQRSVRWATAALGLAAALVIGVLGVTVVRQEDRIDDLARARTAGPAGPTSARGALEVERLLTRPSTRLATLVSEDRAVVVRVVLGADGVGWVLGEQLPALPSGRTYQLWGVNGERVLSLGLLGSHPTTVPFAADGAPPADTGRGRDAGAVWSAFAITAEDGPGVVSSEQTAVVAGTLV